MALTDNPPGLELDSCWRWISEIRLFSGSRLGGLDKELWFVQLPYGGDFDAFLGRNEITRQKCGKN